MYQYIVGLYDVITEIANIESAMCVCMCVCARVCLHTRSTIYVWSSIMWLWVYVSTKWDDL